MKLRLEIVRELMKNMVVTQKNSFIAYQIVLDNPRSFDCVQNSKCDQFNFLASSVNYYPRYCP